MHRSIPVPTRGGFFRKLLAFAGPGYLVAVGYMDPGNWATGLAGGARYGYQLLSVVLLSNLVAMLLQALSVRLGVATGRDLAQTCRDQYSRKTTVVFWLLAEIAIVATDLAEVLGAAIALELLFGLPLIAGVLLTSFDVLLLLYLQQHRFRYVEATVLAMMLTIGGAFAVELLLSHPSLSGIALGLLPTAELFSDRQMLYIAIGIVGATVMPHNLYLHSSLVQTRQYDETVPGRQEAIRFAVIDSTVALTGALLVNAAILIVAAAAFHGTGHQDVADLSDAYVLLAPLLGTTMASTLFAVALLLAGQNATITGTLAGQIVMEGFLQVRLRPWLRRLVTRLAAIVPAVAVIAVAGERAAGSLLILSQVILSLQLPFAVIPLLRFVSDDRRMNGCPTPRWQKVVAWPMAMLIVTLNGWLLVQVVTDLSR